MMLQNDCVKYKSCENLSPLGRVTSHKKQHDFVKFRNISVNYCTMYSFDEQVELEKDPTLD